MNTISGTKNVKDDWGPKTKKFVVNIDQNKAQLAGVTSADIATSLQTVLDGFKTGEYREDDKSIPIMMRSNESQQQTLASIETLKYLCSKYLVRVYLYFKWRLLNLNGNMPKLND